MISTGIQQSGKTLKQISMENKERTRLIVGNGILDQIKPPEPRTFKVEDLYEGFSPNMWPLLDKLLEDRPDLHDRIKKYKESRVA